MWIFPTSPVVYKIYCALGAIIFSFYIIYDVNQIMTKLEPDQYIIGSMMLFLDIINQKIA